MRLVTETGYTDSATTSTKATEQCWPRQARAAALALETAKLPRVERRSIPRHRYRAVGTLTVEAHACEATEVYVREVNPWTISFLSPQLFNTTDHAEIRLSAPDGTELTVRCHVRRCREFIPGWFDCVVQLERQQPLLTLEQILEYVAA